MKIGQVIFLSTVWCVASAICGNAKTGYTLVWGDGESADYVSNVIAKSIDYSKNERNGWDIQLNLGDDSRTIENASTIEFVKYDDSVINSYVLSDGYKLWITPAGYFLETDDEGSETEQVKNMIFTSFDERYSVEISYGDDSYCISGTGESCFINKTDDGRWDAVFINEDEGGETDAEPVAVVLPTDDAYADHPLKRLIYNITSAIDNKTANAGELQAVIDIFKALLDNETIEATQQVESVATALKNKRKKKGNKYSIYVQTSVATSIENLYAKMTGSIRCATYRFNDVGEYGFYVAENSEYLDEKNLNHQLATGGVTQIRCNNQKHLKLSYSDVYRVYQPNKTVYYRAYYKLTKKDQGIYLKFPSGIDQDMSLGKVRSIFMGVHDIPVLTLSYTYIAECFTCNEILPFQTSTHIELKLGDNGDVNVMDNNLGQCIIYSSHDSETPHEIINNHKHAVKITDSSYSSGAGVGKYYDPIYISIQFTMESLPLNIPGIDDFTCSSRNGSVNYVIHQELDGDKIIYKACIRNYNGGCSDEIEVKVEGN